MHETNPSGGSTHDDILDVFYWDIAKKTDRVMAKEGLYPFYAGAGLTEQAILPRAEELEELRRAIELADEEFGDGAQGGCPIKVPSA